MSHPKRHDYQQLAPGDEDDEHAVEYELADRGNSRPSVNPSYFLPVRPTKIHLTLRRPLVYSLLALVFAVLAILYTPAKQYSTSNDLLFRLSAPDGPFLQWGYAEWVSLSAGVTPKRCHSHNDYEQSVPLLKALSYGAASVEADVWLVDNELLVGHTEKELSPNDTLAKLYLEPLQDIIRMANMDRKDDGVTPLHGIFDTAPKLPLQLLIDLKTNGIATFERLYDYLEPLRSAGYLTTMVAASPYPVFTPSVITVIGTGNTPLSSVLALGDDDGRRRDIFLDAPLLGLASGKDSEAANVYTPSVSPLASANLQEVVGWSWVTPWVAKKRIRTFVDAAHKKGIQARFWNTPNFPIWFRNYVWQVLLDEGADWLNVDDLPAAAGF
ncbi:hypothetical protein NEOLEDRAFT_1121820 [Neolentinus lepideus HHB14362 ss-1]|uniref:Altered inheritance of mitochondria protein 6 n=1 Tax=Neolentinus lepideus HHB14362 ss-1 TaxID=1314782 RepID=A0A165PGM8_9AGAM|nr:hypothetical protein NEOLEDRAFT_1121820 [Neolentinus lepideus HHB14362 ss-1]